MYLLSIIDDYIRKMWAYLLKVKSETFYNFNNWKRQVKNQTGKKINFLRTDNDLEFCNTEFETMNCDTPYERWSGKLSDYFMFRTFGCAAFSHQSEGKLELRARKDVTFNENEMPCIKGKIEPVSKAEPGKERHRFKVELGKFSTPVPTTPIEVEIQV
ncbi:uncharacterized protein LOC111366847 [Olea europaea var. sylvestris]|uniref:uncharacterized protein LOC111366847 n=1 Tax=Olea europaea var. sylvestris TaxID=158386 RepID=UPI000C1D23A2|nr:uncharacterized protein LOC111366847 [Olea europaea var. sylvestris]